MTLHEMLREAGFATEAREYLEPTEYRLKLRKLEGLLGDPEELKKELDETADGLREVERELSNLKDDYDALERERDTLSAERSKLRVQIEEQEGLSDEMMQLRAEVSRLSEKLIASEALA